MGERKEDLPVENDASAQVPTNVYLLFPRNAITSGRWSAAPMCCFPVLLNQIKKSVATSVIHGANFLEPYVERKH